MEIKINRAAILAALPVLLLANGCKQEPVPEVPVDDKEKLVVDSGTYIDGQGNETQKRIDYSEYREPCSLYNPYRSPYVGDLHVHTERSLDAGIQDTRTTPAQAYNFAKGEALDIQPWTTDDQSLRSVKLAQPLDFAMVSDHAEFFGETHVCNDASNPAAYDSVECIEFREDPRSKFVSWNFKYLGSLLQPQGALSRFDFCGEGAKDCLDMARPVWQEMIDSAEAAYDKTGNCEFTALVGYEYTGAPLSFNLHRNVVFKNADVPGQALSYMEYPRPENLWRALDETCNDSTNCEALTIPHNSNVSGDFMFRREKLLLGYTDFDEEYVKLRNKYEPLIEIFQHKGDSECSRSADEFCGFEKFPFNNLISDRFAGFLSKEPNEGSFLRSALKDGLALEEKHGTNPFKYGVIASTDTHLGTPGLVSEENYPGHGGAGADNGDQLVEGLTDFIAYGPGGLAILWAEENSRDYLFDAMQRKEAQGTSGPRILLRLFAGWDLDKDRVCEGFSYDENAISLTRGPFVQESDSKGVPMGSDLTKEMGYMGGAPTISVGAIRDSLPTGNSLQTLQIIKGWIDNNGKSQERVYTLNQSIKNKSLGINLDTCEATVQPTDALCDVWVDPDFDASQKAFYYARVMEQPTCRWSWKQCSSLFPENPVDNFRSACKDPKSLPDGYEDCCLHEHLVDSYTNEFKKGQFGSYPPIIQERAWSSPVWYNP